MNATNTVTFPTHSLEPSNSTVTADSTNLSIMSRHATALEVCDLVYGDGDGRTSILDAIERFYEGNAGDYENPFITAASRSVISDIYSLSSQLTQVDIPKPVAMLYILFGKQHELEGDAASQRWFQALRVWTEVGEVAESESFDGHRRCIIEHTLNILLLPGLHTDRITAAQAGRFTQPSAAASSSSLSLPSSPPTTSQLSTYAHPTDPALSVPLVNLLLPSPFHLQLHVITRLSFNESGRITHHRDFWDVKDLVGLVPGGTLAQWVASRMVGTGLTSVARMFGFSRPNKNRRSAREATVYAEEHEKVWNDNRTGTARDLESGFDPAHSGLTPAAAYARNAMRFIRSSFSGSLSHLASGSGGSGHAR